MPEIEEVSWDQIKQVYWECGGQYLMDDFHIIDDKDHDYVVPSEAVVTFEGKEGHHSLLVDVLERKELFSKRRYIGCVCVAEQGVTICEE